MHFVKRCIKNFFFIFGLRIQKISRKDNVQLDTEMWKNDAEFNRLLAEIDGNTVVSPDRCFMLWQLAKYAASKEGAIAEVGVYKGGTAKIIAKACPNKKVHLFDTFSGMPKEDVGVDLHKQGDFSDTSFQLVEQFLNNCDNVEFHPGFFPSTADNLKDKKFCFVHIDVDIYESAKSCLDFFYDKLVTGGIMVFDDYYWRGCPGINKAVEEFLNDKQERPIITVAVQAMIIKL